MSSQQQSANLKALLMANVALAAIGFALILAVVLIRVTFLAAQKSKAWTHAKTRAQFATVAVPQLSVSINDNLANTFETPVLFFVVSGLLIASGLPITDEIVTLANFYVATRAVHSIVQSLQLPITLRFSVFALGLLSLGKIWVDFALAVSQIA